MLCTTDFEYPEIKRYIKLLLHVWLLYILVFQNNIKTSRIYSNEEYDILKHIHPNLAQSDTLWYNSAIIPLVRDLDFVVVDIIISIRQLRTVVLRDIDMRACFPIWPNNWEQVENVGLRARAIQHILTIISHAVHVSFIMTNVEDYTVCIISESPYFILTILDDRWNFIGRCMYDAIEFDII